MVDARIKDATCLLPLPPHVAAVVAVAVGGIVESDPRDPNPMAASCPEGLPYEQHHQDYPPSILVQHRKTYYYYYCCCYPRRGSEEPSNSLLAPLYPTREKKKTHNCRRRHNYTRVQT